MKTKLLFKDLSPEERKKKLIERARMAGKMRHQMLKMSKTKDEVRKYYSDLGKKSGVKRKRTPMK